MTVLAPSAPGIRTQPIYAGFWIRVLAFLIDSIAIGIIVGFVTLGRPLPVTGSDWGQAANWHNFIETVIGFAYFTIMWSSIAGGQTLGMRVLNLRVVGRTGAPIGFGTAILRWFGFVLSAAVVLLGLLWVAFDPRKQGWHDKIAGTYVVTDAAEPVTSEWAETPASAPAVQAGTARHPVARGFAVALGLLGGGVGLLGVGLALAGDAVIPIDSMLLVAGVFAGLAVVAAISAWWRPGMSAFVLAIAVFGYWAVLGSHLGPWVDGYNLAVANPVSEQQYWIDAPAMGGFITSAVLVAFAALLAAIGSPESTDR